MKARRTWLRAFVFIASLLLLSETAHARGKSCVEVSDTVGETKCSRYGDTWSIERQLPLVSLFGLRYAEVNISDRSFVEAYKKRHRPKGYVPFKFKGSELGPNVLFTGGFDGGIHFFLVGQLYAGVETGVLFGSIETKRIAVPQGTLRDAGGIDVIVVHGGAPIGYRIPLGRASIRTEVFFGGLMVDVSHKLDTTTTNTDTPVSSTLNRTSTAGRGVIEPRLAAELWLTQHLTFGAYAGANVLDSNARAFGVTLAWHGRAFDGDVSLW